MEKKARLKRVFNKVAAALLLSAGVATTPISATEVSAPVAPVETTACAAYPDFKKPETPMHRISRNIEPDPAIKERQSLLRALELPLGTPDGRLGSGTRHAMREFLLFYGPLYGAADYKRELDEKDTAELRRVVERARADAKIHALPVSVMAALHLASDRTGVALDKLTDAVGNGKGRIEGIDTAGTGTILRIGHAPWLALVKTYGEKYGLGFYADHITLEKKQDGLHPSVSNPFIHRQILNLKNNPRLAALLAAEYIAHADHFPAIAKPTADGFDPALKEQQEALRIIGFDIGPGAADGIHGTMTNIALREFQILHGEGIPSGILSERERVHLRESASFARAGAMRYDAPAEAVAAIRMASAGSGLDFSYMMELAAAESSFAAAIKAKSSSATGLYQFIESTWHGVIHDYGDKYGLKDFSGEVETYEDDYGRKQARINNPLIRGQVLEMRKHPHLSALFSADFQLENRGKQQCYITGDLSNTDMYLAHFLGAHDAVYFINAMRNDDDLSAVKVFPEAAEYNSGVFYEAAGRKTMRERSLGEVYNFFSAKFDKGIYNDPVREPEAPVPAKKMAAAKGSHPNAGK